MADEEEPGPPHCPYERLGLDPSCTDEDIRRAYRRAALIHHPDRHDSERREAASEKFRHVAEAYETLNHPDKREAYHQSISNQQPSSRGVNDFYDAGDEFVSSFFRDMEPTHFSSRHDRRANSQRQRHHRSSSGLFDEMHSMHSSLFSSFFNENFGFHRRNMQGSMMSDMMRGFDEDFSELMGDMHAFSGDRFFSETSNSSAFRDMNAPRRTSSVSVRSYSVTDSNGHTYTRREKSTQLRGGRTNTIREDFVDTNPSSYGSTSRWSLGN